MQKILFIGASGMLGKPVARELIKAGFELSLLARNVPAMQSLFPGINIIAGDLFDQSSLERAMQGQDIVYLNISVAQTSRKKQAQPEREGIINTINAAKKTGIKRIAYLSSLVKNYEGMNGFHWWAFQLKHAAEAAIKTSGIPYSIFYPSAFMETLDGQMLAGKKLMLVKGTKAKMWFIAATDYGQQVAKAFSIAGNNNQEYAIQGKDAYDLNEAATIFIKNYKTPVKILNAPLGLLKFMGLFVQKMNYGAHICEALNKYPEKFESEKAWRDLGEPVTSLADYTKNL